jgi:anti-sigma-K factor RskA
MPSIGGITAAEEARLRAQLDRARQRVELNEADNFALQHQLEQLRSDLAAATNHAASLEKDLASEQAQEKGKERIATRPNADAATALAAQLERSQAEVRRLSAAAGNGSKIERLLESPSLQQIFLRSVVPQAGGATARALYSPQGGLLLIADSLPALPDQKCYQVWLIRKSAPAITSAGLITLQAGGKGILFAPPSSELAEVTALAITDEPAGGSVSSRGKKLLFGAQ